MPRVSCRQSSLSLCRVLTVMVLRPVALAGKYCLLSRTGTSADTPVAESKAAALLSMIFPPNILIERYVDERQNTNSRDKRPQPTILYFSPHREFLGSKLTMLDDGLIHAIDTRCRQERQRWSRLIGS